MSEKPKRIQRKRTKGWKMPPNTVYVGRPTKWGNPFTVAMYHERYSGNGFDAIRTIKNVYEQWIIGAEALHWQLYIEQMGNPKQRFTVDEIKVELRGKNLACWCREGESCHADILLELANKI